MIEKNAVFRLLVGVCIFVGAVFLLVHFFDILFCELIKEILIAVVTGCAFAFPGVIFYIKTAEKHNKRERRKLLERLEEIFAEESVLPEDATQNQAPPLSPANLLQLRNIYYELLHLINENFVENVHLYERLQTHLDKILTANKLSTCSPPINISEQIDSCRKLIAEILKRNPYVLTKSTE